MWTAEAIHLVADIEARIIASRKWHERNSLALLALGRIIPANEAPGDVAGTGEDCRRSRPGAVRGSRRQVSFRPTVERARQPQLALDEQ